MLDPLGKKIRDLRQSRNMTLKDLSEETGFSISFISQLERGKSNATLESLKKISIALKISPSYFFEEHIPTDNSVEIERLTKHNITYTSLSSSIPNPAFEPLLVHLKPGQNEGNAFSHNGQEFLYVLSGELTVLVDNEEIVLSENQSIMFDSNKKHYWYNYTDQVVTFLCIAYDFD